MLHRNKKKGFTLVEMLVSIGILAIVVGIGGDVLATVMRAYKKAEFFSMVEGAGNNTLSLIEQDVRSSIDVRVEENGTQLTVYIPKDGEPGNTPRKYNINTCNGDDTGSIELNDSPQINTSDEAVTGENLYVDTFPGLVPFNRVNPDEGKQYDVMFISFMLKEDCNDEEDTLKAYFQTTVNLRGGLQ